MKPRPFRPMKGEAAPEDLSTLRFPLLVPPKLDGFRCVVRDRVAFSNSMKPHRNRFVQDCFARWGDLLNGLDGELVVGPPVGPDVINRTSSALRREDGEPDFTFHVFDDFDYVGPFKSRFMRAFGRVTALRHEGCRFVEIVPHQLANDAADVARIEDDYVTQGYEGVMLRDPFGHYKFGKATVKEGLLLKLKRFFDEEAEIVGYKEQLTNTNEQTRDERGLSKRSTAKDGMLPAGTLGALECRFLTDGVRFSASRFTDEQAAALWAIRETLPGRIAKIKHWGRTQPDRAPRFPQFVDLREAFDMDQNAA